MKKQNKRKTKKRDFYFKIVQIKIDYYVDEYY